MSETKLMALREAVNLAMSEEMRKDENIFLMGEDVGIYGGDFGTSVGMLAEFGEKRVKDTPISEAAIAGAAVGSAITGLRPIVDLTFMDFITIALDAIVNNGAKKQLHVWWWFEDSCNLPCGIWFRDWFCGTALTIS